MAKKMALKSQLFYAARRRATERNLEFTITVDDIYVPTHCPILGIELKRNPLKKNDDSPTIDRLDNTKGYTPDNIWVISSKANCMKSNATPQDLLFFAEWANQMYGELRIRNLEPYGNMYLYTNLRKEYR